MTLLFVVDAFFLPHISTAETMIIVLRLYADLPVRILGINAQTAWRAGLTRNTIKPSPAD
jgi:hypothetical protein